MFRASRLIIFKGLILGFCASLFFSSTPVSAQSASLIISEINPFGSINSSNCKTVESRNRCSYDKWLEIHNPTQERFNLKDWSLQFRQSQSANDNLLIIQDIVINPGGYYLVGYKEINFQSTLQVAGVQPGGITGKIRNLSNKSQGTIQVNLLNPERQTVFGVNLNTADYPDVLDSDERRSLEYSKGTWTLSTNEFYSNNFGTPRNTAQILVDLDNQRDDRIVVAPPPPKKPEPTKTPPSPPSKPELEVAPKAEPKAVPTPVESLEPAAKPIAKTKNSPEPVKSIAENLLQPSPAFRPVVEQAVQIDSSKTVVESTSTSLAPQSTVTVASVSTTKKVQDLIKKQSAVFSASKITEQVVDNATIETISASTTTTITKSRQLWEYFLSYQAIGVLVILLAIAYAFASREELSRGFNFSFQYHPSLEED